MSTNAANPIQPAGGWMTVKATYSENVPGRPGSYKTREFRHEVEMVVPLNAPVYTPEGRAEYIVWERYAHGMAYEAVTSEIEAFHKSISEDQAAVTEVNQNGPQ